MQAVTRASQSIFPKIDQADIEPDESWKTTLRSNIEASLNDMVKEAKENLENRLKEGPVSVENREILQHEYHKSMQDIRKIATETFHAELEREREQRRWAAGQAMRPEWTEALKQEQQAILDKINHEKNERAKGKPDDQVSGTKPPDIGLGRPSPISPATAPPMFVSTTSQHSSFSPLPQTPDREERERRSAPAQSLRRATDSLSTSNSRDDFSSPSGRRGYGSFRGERPGPGSWESWGHQEPTDDPEELLRPPERSRPPIERSLALDRPGETTPSRPIERTTRTSSERHTTHSPPGHVERWIPSISPEEDAASSRLHVSTRRGSTASLRSNGSANFRPPVTPAIVERVPAPDRTSAPEHPIPDRPTLLERSNIAEYATIPEHADDTASEGLQRERERLQEVDAAWAPIERSRDKERQTVARTDSRQSSSSDQGQRREEQSVASAKAAGKASGRPQDSPTTYQQPLTNHRPVIPRTSFSTDSREPFTQDEQSPAANSKSSAKASARIPDPPYPVSSPSHRPVVPRSSFTRDEDIYVQPSSRPTNRSSSRPQDPPPSSHRPISSRNTYSVEDREYRVYDDRPRVPSNGSSTKPTARPPDYSSGPKPMTRQLSVEGYESYPYEERPRAPSTGNYSSRQPMESPSTGPHPASHRTYVSQAPNSREEDDLHFQEEYRPYTTRAPGRSMTLASAMNDDRDYYPESRYTASSSIPPSRVSEQYTPFSMTRANGRDYAPRENYDLRLDHDLILPGQPQPLPFPPLDMPFQRSSEASRPNIARGPSFSREEIRNRQVPGFPETYDRSYMAATASIPITGSRRSPTTDELTRPAPGDWPPPPPRASDRYESRYMSPTQPAEASSQSWQSSVSPMSSYPETSTYHNFGGRAARDAYENNVKDSQEREEAEAGEMKIRRRIEEVAKREEGIRLREEEARRRDELAKKEEEARREVEARQREEARRREEKRREEKRKEEEEKRLEEERKEDERRKEVARKEEERRREAARREEEEREEEERREAERRFEEEKQKEYERLEEVRREELREQEERKRREELRREEERQRREDEKRRETEAIRREAEERRIQEESWRKVEEARRKEAEIMQKELEARRMEEEAMQKAAEARLREEEAIRKAELARLKEEEIRRREEDVKRREDELNRREEEARRREHERRRKEEEQLRYEREQQQRLEEEQQRKEEERLRKEEEQNRMQQEFRKREEDIRRRVDERKRQDSIGTDSSWTGYSSTATSSSSGRSVPPRSGSTTGTSSTTATPNWSNSPAGTWSSVKPNPPPSSTPPGSGRPPPTPTSKPRAGSTGSASSGSYSAPPLSEAEWARRQAEHFQKQQEQFRREQERLETERQAKANRIMGKEDVVQLFDTHERQWTRLATLDELRWESFPWPMLKKPSLPEEITSIAISAYILSPHYPEKDKSRPIKDRIKEHIRRWHPDRFETKLLTKVADDEREKVKEGAGSVVRSLNDLLTRSSVLNVFS